MNNLLVILKLILRVACLPEAIRQAGACILLQSALNVADIQKATDNKTEQITCYKQ